jgi:hypothetical protein
MSLLSITLDLKTLSSHLNLDLPFFGEPSDCGKVSPIVFDQIVWDNFGKGAGVPERLREEGFLEQDRLRNTGLLLVDTGWILEQFTASIVRVSSFETSVNMHQIRLCKIPEDSQLYRPIISPNLEIKRHRHIFLKTYLSVLCLLQQLSLFKKMFEFISYLHTAVIWKHPFPVADSV